MEKQTSILLVDDHVMIRKGLRALIEQEQGFFVAGEAADGREAIEKVRELQPEVVVMDINMPNLNGIEATRQILAESPEARILALSIHSTKRYVEEMLEAGVAGYLLKESAPEELLSAICALRDGKGYLSSEIADIVISKAREATSAAHNNKPERRKWSRPVLPENLLHRHELVNRLENGHHKLLTQVVAPAGYGKTVLVSDWANRHPRPYLWLSVEPEDNDLRWFLESWIELTEEFFVGLPRYLPGLVTGANLPPVSILAGALMAELEECQRDLTVVLENMHLVKDKVIFDLLSQVLKSPIESFHLVVVSRQDPFLPLSTLRSDHQLSEIRTEDLRFTVEDIQSYLQISLGRDIDKETAESWEERTEGWVTGLQLAIHSLDDSGSVTPTKTFHAGRIDWRTILTNREFEVLLLLQERMRDKEIADRLCISTETVKTHLKNVYSKLQAADRRDAVVRAQQLNIL